MAQSFKKADIVFVVPCDDIRQEINGKYIAIGIYTDAFLPSALPISTFISFLVWVRVPSGGEYMLEMEMVLEPSNKVIAKVGCEFVTDNAAERSAIAFPLIALRVDEPGALVVRTVDGGEEVLRLPIEKPFTLTTASPPPSAQSQPASQG